MYSFIKILKLEVNNGQIVIMWREKQDLEAFSCFLFLTMPM